MKLIQNSIAQIKNKKNKFLLPFSTYVYKRFKITSNSLTLFSFLMGILAAVTLFENHTYFTIFIILSVILDIFDGSIAELE
ncbi:hypothetical protein GF354_04175, partial [Candidatus Peregrinibacteria bacterium]|nr:hypothetical protein [Candidatus Peregrinibacteria bacterium]